jgi:acetyl esterase/lipase
MTAAPTIMRDVVYASLEQDLHCDLYEPSDEARGVLIMLHGGGWRVGSRAAVEHLGERAAARGWWGVGAQYRLLPEAPWPAQVQDVKRVVRWAHTSTDRFGEAAGRVALLGLSAGAHLALMAGGTGGTDAFPLPEAAPDESERPDAVVSFYPPAHIDEIDARHLGVESGERESASPFTHLSDRYPPTLLLHGSGDTMVPYGWSVELFEAITALGVPADLRLYARAQHDFQRLPELTDLVCDDIVNFLDRHLVQREAFDAHLAEADRSWRERSAQRTAEQG